LLQLLIGPPGAGKTTRVLERVRQAARRGRDDVRLLVPTATMAEHLRNELARSGLLVRRRSVQTLWRFLEAVAGDLPQVPAATLRLLVREALEAEGKAFGEIKDFAGFQGAVADRLEELGEAGLGAAASAALLDSDTGKALSAVYARVEEALRRRGLYWRAERLRAAAGRVAREGVSSIGTLAFDGFFSFTAAEMELIAALGERHDVVVTLPEWTGTARLRRELRRRGGVEERCERVRPRPAIEWFAAPSLLRETEEIARQILEQAAAGRPFREMGVVLRSRSRYLPALQSTFERFGIPARFYFAEPLEEHPTVQRLARVIEARLSGWDHEKTLAACRMGPASASLDRFEFAVLARIPDKGLEPLEAHAGDDRLRELLAALRRIDAWPDGVLPAAKWAERLRALTDLFPPAWVPEPMGHEEAARWRTATAALAAFKTALDETAAAIGAGTLLELAEFWREARAVLASTALRPPDHRRNVVHVLDVYEARQWELPIVFVCGLLEGQFPLHHAEDPLLDDAERRRLCQRGVCLPTTEDRNAEERFLFEVATTRATERLVLSYPRFDERGDELLASFLLEEFLERERAQQLSPVAVRVQGARAAVPYEAVAVTAPELRHWLAEKHATLSASSIETFLECPFRFFALYSVRLEAPPPAPRERLDALLQGEIVHAVLSEHAGGEQDLEPVFEKIFEEKCRAARVPLGYRREAIRRELLRNLKAYMREPAPWEGTLAATEKRFEFALEDGLRICGKIDRIDQLADGRALVIDYKYSSPYRLRELMQGHEEGDKVQGGIYLVAARRALGLEPAGMLFASLRNGVKWVGHRASDAIRAGILCSPEQLESLAASASARAVEVARQIQDGVVAPRPADESVCKYCDYREICRVESQAKVDWAGGGAA